MRRRERYMSDRVIYASEPYKGLQRTDDRPED